MLLAELPTGCLEPALFPLHSLGVATVRSRKRLGFLLVCRLVRLGRLIDTHECVTLGLELERMCLEAGNRGVKLSKVHGVCGLACMTYVRCLTGTGHVFFEQWLKNSRGIVITDADLREDSDRENYYHRSGEF